MAALVSNLIRPLDLGASAMTRAAVAGADQAFPGGFVFGGQGINGSSSSNYFENAEVATVTDDWYSAWAAFTGPTSIDMSAIDRALVCHFKVNDAGFTNVKAVRMCLRSGTGTANWGVWEYAIDSTGANGLYHPFMMIGAPDSTVGTFDNTDVTGFCFQAQASNGDLFAFAVHVDQLVFIDGPAELGDTGAAATLETQDYFDLCKQSSSEAYRTQLVAKAGPTFEFGFPIKYTTDDYNSASVAEGLAFKEADGVGYPAMPSGFFQLIFEPQVSGSQVFSNLSAATNSTPYDLTINGSAASSTLDFTSSLFAGVNDAVISGANLSLSATIANPSTCDIADGNIEATIASPASPVIVSANLASGSSVSITNPAGDSLQFDAPAGDFSGTVFTLPSSTVNINGAGTYDLSSIESTGSIEFDNLTASAVTVSIDPTLSATTADPTTGGGSLTIDTPVFSPTVTLTGLQNPTEIRIFTAGTQTELVGQEIVSSGTFSDTLPPGTSSVDISILSLGYKNARILNVSTAQDVSIPVSQEIDRQYLNP